MAEEAAVQTAPEPVAPDVVAEPSDPTRDTIQIEVDPVDASLEQPADTTVETPTEPVEPVVEPAKDITPPEPSSAEKRVTALEEELKRAQYALQVGDTFLMSDKEAQAGWLKFRKARGEQLTPNEEAAIAPKVAPPTLEKIKEKIHELRLAGDEEGAEEIRMKFIIEPRIEARLREERDAQRKVEAEAAAIRAGEQVAKDEMALLATTYGDKLVAKDPANPTGYGFKDAAVLAKIQEVKKRNHFITLPDAMKLALIELDRWGSAAVKKATPKAQIVAKPNAPKILSRSTPAPVNKRANLEKFEDLIEIEVN